VPLISLVYILLNCYPGNTYDNGLNQLYLMSKATYEHKLTFLETDGNYGPIIHTHAFPTPAVKGSLVRLECIAYGS